MEHNYKAVIHVDLYVNLRLIKKCYNKIYFHPSVFLYKFSA